MAIMEENMKIPPLCEGTMSPCLAGVEDLMMEESSQMEYRSDLKPTLNNTEFKLELENNWNDILPNYSENSLLKDAFEELHSTITNQESPSLEIKPGSTQFCQIPSQTEDSLSNFEDLEEFFSRVNTENLQTEFQKEETELIAETVPDFDIIKCEQKDEHDEFLGSLFLKNTVPEFPNLIANLNETTENCKVTTVESNDVFDQNLEMSSAFLSATNSLLSELMITSGINNEPDIFNGNENTESRKRKTSDNVSVSSAKSPKMAENEYDDNQSIYSSCVSSPEDNRIVERRKKNNIASKISRANRKTKHQQLFEKEKQLQQDNVRLRILIEKIAKEADKLRKILIDKLSGNA